MAQTYLLFILGFILLIFGANLLIKNSLLLGKKHKISSVIMGIVVVGFGSSLPELVISIVAVLKDSTEIAVSNAIGSNIANILVILGIIALISKIDTDKHTNKIKIPFLIITSVFVFLVSNDTLFWGTKNCISTIDGIIFLLIFIFFIYYSLFIYKDPTLIIDELSETQKDEKIKSKSFFLILLILLSLGGLLLGSNLVVDKSMIIADHFGVSESFIGVSILAFGSSLPEIISSVIAIKKFKDSGMAVGNIIGSVLFNTYLILGVASLIKPLIISGEQQFNIIINIASTILFFLFLVGGKKGNVSKYQGVIMLLLFLLFLYISYLGIF